MGAIALIENGSTRVNECKRDITSTIHRLTERRHRESQFFPRSSSHFPRVL